MAAVTRQLVRFRADTGRVVEPTYIAGLVLAGRGAIQWKRWDMPLRLPMGTTAW
jgi:hypothetical protein